jgi:autotransporter-associated beta strand protein
VDSPTLIGAETLRLLGNVTLFDIDTNAGTTVDLQGNTLTMIGKNNGSHTVAGSIKGIGGSLMKVGNDPLTLNGANTYTGPTAVANGALIVNGSLSASSTVSITGNGILGGTGFVGKVINNGVVNPGSPGAPGILTIAGDLTFGPGTLVLDLAANGSDRVNDTGPTIDITGTTLSLNVGTITPNEKFTILVTPGDITGRFANLPTTGSSFTVGSLTFTINYDAGVGDDATVTLQASGGNPSLVGTLLNGGINYVNSALATHQHSMVENVVYSFTQAVSLSASNFTLSGIQGTPPSLVPNVSVSGSGMLWTVSFTGAGVNAATNSIADGEFELVLSGVAGMATSTYDFFRLLGDMDGNGTVDTSDFATLVSTFLRASTDPLYLGADDFDGDNTFGTSDFAEFTGNFLKTLPAPLPN